MPDDPNNKKIEQPRADGSADSRRDEMPPEPPPGWNPQAAEDAHYAPTDNQASPHVADSNNSNNRTFTNNSSFFRNQFELKLEPGEADLLTQAQKYLSISQICAVISLFFGGVVLSSASLVIAIAGFRKLKPLASKRAAGTRERAALMRSGIVPIVMCVLALIFNIISMIVMYPLILQAAQSGDFTNLLGNGSAPQTIDSTWG